MNSALLLVSVGLWRSIAHLFWVIPILLFTVIYFVFFDDILPTYERLLMEVVFHGIRISSDRMTNHFAMRSGFIFGRE